MDRTCFSNAGNPKASHFLADFYREGIGVDKDIDHAIKLFQTATEGGSVMAFAAMGKHSMKWESLN